MRRVTGGRDLRVEAPPTLVRPRTLACCGAPWLPLGGSTVLAARHRIDCPR